MSTASGLFPSPPPKNKKLKKFSNAEQDFIYHKSLGCGLSSPLIFPHVDFLMSRQAVAPTEALPTFRAPIGFHPRVKPLMPDQVRVLTEALLALGALVGLLPGVDPLVPDETRMGA